MPWQVQEAKQRFSEFIRKAVDEGPQVVTRHGREVAVLLSAEAYHRLKGDRDFKTFLLSAPSLDGLDLDRSTDPARDLDL